MRILEEIGRARIALVLGAGGPVAHAFHAGTLAALEDAAGWDARSAALIVGTSAGAGVAVLIRAGMRGRDLLARVRGEPLSTKAAAIARGYERPVPDRSSPARARPTASAAYLRRTLLRPWTVRPGRLMAAVLPAGRTDLAPYAARLSALFDGAWPDDPTWLPAVRLHDGRTVAFGQDEAPKTDVGRAVASSSAVPGIFAPVEIQGEHYVDGGIASAVHLAIAADSPHIDTVIVSSPLSRMPGMRGLLRSEIAGLRRQGIDVWPFEPGPKTARAMGWNPMDASRGPDVATAAYDETLGRLLAPPLPQSRLGQARAYEQSEA